MEFLYFNLSKEDGGNVMKIESVKLVYFSPTGTTKKIVERIAHGFKHSTVKIVDITKPEGRKQKLQTLENELLIVGVPVYFGRVQTNAIEWLNTIEAHNTPIVCIVVYGNHEYGDALLELKYRTVKNGCIPIACAAYVGEHSLSNSETPIAAGRPDSDDLSHAELFGKKIEEKLLSISSINQVTDITVPGNYSFVNSVKEHNIFYSAANFNTVNDNCSQCGVCAQECPVSAIDSENSTSIDIKKCILCCTCIKKCPSKARTIRDIMAKNIARQLSRMCQKRKEPIWFL
jgi:ferredoxin